MVGQASSPDIMMTSGDACPTNEGSLKVAAKGSLIRWNRNHKFTTFMGLL